MLSGKICILCNTPLSTYLQVKDYFLTQEEFNLERCPECQLLITSPAPDPEQIGRYYDSSKYLSHSSNNTNLISFLYNFIRKISINNKLSLINTYKKGHILDYGCGTGEFLQACQQDNWVIHGLEPNEAARKRAMQQTGREIYANVKQLDNTTYNVITLWHVLEHMPDPVKAITQLKEKLSSGGAIILALPNHQSPDAAYYREYWAGYDVPRHLFHFSKSSVLHLAQETGMNIVSMHPMKFDAYYVALLSEKYKRPDHFAYLRAAWRGWRSNRSARKNSNYSSLIYVLQPQV